MGLIPMNKKVKQEELPTVKKYKKYKNLHRGLKAASYGACLVPFGIELGVHWNEWFKPSDGQISIGVGFGMLLVSTLATLVAVMKKDEEFMKKYSPLFYVAVIVSLWAGSFMFLSSIMSEMGQMLLYTAIGVAVGAVTDEVNTLSVKPQYEKYEKLINEYGLTDKAEDELNIVKQAKKDQQERAKQKREATE